MKITDKTKRKAADQRLKRIKAYYKHCYTGAVVYNKNFVKYIVALGKELNGEYYLLVQNIHGETLLKKLVYNGSVDIVGVSRQGRTYSLNQTVFDSWFKEAKRKINCYIRYTYNITDIGKEVDSKKLVLKKEFNDDYYFVFRLSDGRVLIYKLIWYDTVRPILISGNEYNENKTVFYEWKLEAKYKR